MKEDDIRPNTFAARQRVAMLQDVGRLLTRRNEFVEVTCPACAGSSRALKWEKFGLVYWECQDCRTVYISPRPSPEVLKWFYAESINYAFWNKYIFPASEPARRQNIFVPRVNRFLELCAKHGVVKGAVLEVGAGFGTFCEELRSRNVFKRIVAVEPTLDLASHCRSRGTETIQKPFETLEFGPGERFDAVVAFEVLEHLFSPEGFLRLARPLLNTNGLVLVTCPNLLGFDILVLGPQSDSVDAEHLNYFHPTSMAALFERCGFEVLEVLTPGQLDAELVRKKTLSGEFRLDGQVWLKRILIDDWERVGGAFQAFLATERLSSHMWICAKNSSTSTA
jgi:2-polyprenyl-3-methyl-5-hydroxy-6-metoxy-1,4-benzoquinol methylase/ribosomal protein L37AE/L43A